LLDRVSFKKDQFSLFKLHLKLNGIAANFAILNVLLPGNRGIKQHRNLLKAMGTLEEMFIHGNKTGKGVKS
jgi:hypothetical protein